MTLLENIKELFKNGVEPFHDSIEITNKKGVTIKRDTKKLRQLSLAAISTDTAKEFYSICRINCDVGTIIEPFENNEKEWEELYNDVISLCRISIMKEMMDERFVKSANVLMKILEKRDKNHWGDEKKVDVVTDGQPIHISIMGVN